MDIINFLVIIAFVINLFLSLFIHFRARKTTANRMFQITAFGITCWVLAMFFYRSANPSTVVMWAKFLYFFPTFIPTAFLLFGLYFPTMKVKRIIPILVFATNLIMAFLTIYDSSVIRSVDIISGKEHIIHFGWAYYNLYIFYFPLFFILSYLVLFLKYFKQKNKYIRLQILYILLGMSAASIPPIFTNLNLPTFGYFQLNWVGQVVTVFWIAGVAYAIIRQRLMDIKLLVARTVMFTLLISALVLIYGIGVFLLGQILSEKYLGNSQLYASLVTTLIIVLSFQSIKGTLERLTNRVFYKNKYDSNLFLQKLGKITTSTLNLTDLSDSILKEVLSEMLPTGLDLILFKDGVMYWSRHLGDFNLELNVPQQREIYNLVQLIVDHHGEDILVYVELDEDDNRKEIMRRNNMNVLLPLVVENDIVGALLLGDKSSGDIYSPQDIDILKIIAPEVAVAVRNALSYEEIKRFNVTLTEEVDKATEDLQKANEHLKQLDHLKDEFVSLASHELRTPMTVVKSYLWMVLQDKNGKLNEQQKLYLERAATASDGLINLVNDMLNVSRIESGRFSIEKQDIDIEDLVKTTVTELTPEAKTKGLHLEFQLGSKDIPAVLSVDPERIKQVLINLIGNSLKFTPKNGKIIVALSKSDSKVMVQIKDNGVGISKENVAKLFQKFGLLRESYQKSDTQGTGLGLYICKSIIELHGGKIWAESAGEGKGTTFTFTLPLK